MEYRSIAKAFREKMSIARSFREIGSIALEFRIQKLPSCPDGFPTANYEWYVGVGRKNKSFSLLEANKLEIVNVIAIVT